MIYHFQVASLFSSYFFNIFYGGFKENREQWPTIQDVNSDAICAGIADTVIRSSKFPDILALHLPMLNWSGTADTIEHFDRFSFIQQFSQAQAFLRRYVEQCGVYDEQTVRGFQEITIITRTENYPVSFVLRSRYFLNSFLYFFF